MWIVFGFISSIFTMMVVFFFVQNVYLSITAALVIFICINSLVYYFQLLKERKIRSSSIEKINHMSGIEFEEYLHAILKKLGYKVFLTETTGDFGADLILQKDGIKTVVQAKRYKGSVGIKAVQEIFGAKSYYDAQDAWVITNSYYTKAAKALALKSNVRLLNRNSLIELALDAGIQPTTLYQTNNIKNEASKTELIEKNSKQCPICSNEMVIRNGKHGRFYGCSNFPVCRGTLPYQK